MSVKDFVIPSGQGSVWHMAPGRSATLKITSDIAQSVMMFEEVAPTDTVTTLHIHHGSDEVAYVLSGEVTFMIGDQVTVGGAGTARCAAGLEEYRETSQGNVASAVEHEPGRADEIMMKLIAELPTQWRAARDTIERKSLLHGRRVAV